MKSMLPLPNLLRIRVPWIAEITDSKNPFFIFLYSFLNATQGERKSYKIHAARITIKLGLLMALMIFFSEKTQAQIPTSGLHGLYNFSGGSLEDVTANSNDFTQSGTALTTVNDRFGDASNAVSLNGDHLTRSDINFPNSGQDLNLGTIGFWIKTTTNDDNIRTILDDTNGRSNPTSDDTWAGYYFYLLDGKVGISGRVQWSVASLGYQGVGVLSDDVISNGDWHHVVATVKSNQRFTGASDISSANVTLYVDGALQGTSTATRVRSFGAGGISQSQTLDQTGNITVSNNRDNNLPTENRYQDEIDEITFHTRNLTAAEITQMSTTGGYCFANNTDLAIASVDEDMIDITLPTDATYDVAIHKESEAFSGATIVTDIDDGAETLSGLSASSYYLIYIKEHCTESLKSPWSTSVRVRTSGPIYVDTDAAGLANGSSWADAYTDVQTALVDVSENSEIWIAEGTYSPGSARTDYFDFDGNDLSVYGGFEGTETVVTERDPSSHLTILSADVNGDDTGVDFTGNNRTENNYHVALITAHRVTLDGLQFNDGHANGSGNDATGGGILLRDQVQGTQSLSPTFRNCTFKNNVSTLGGAGILMRIESGNTNVTIESCVFDNNVSVYGTGIYFLVDRARTINFDIANTLFSNNTSKDNGGTQGFTGSSMWVRTNSNQSVLNTTITNCTFANNIDIGNRADAEKGTVALSKVTTSSASAVHNAYIYNSIIYGNTDVISNATPSINKGHEVAANVSSVFNSTSEDNFSPATSTTSVSDANPLFSDAANDDFTLQSGSPAVDTGDNSYASSFAEDLAGNARVHNTTVDQGAFEFGSSPPVFRTLMLSAGDNGTIAVDMDPFDEGYLDGASVELTATPDPGFKLEAWGGDASGTDNPLTVTMDANKTISATFIPIITDDNVTVANSSLCLNESTNVSLEGSDVGARYYLRNSADDSVIDGPLDGDGNALAFSTGAMINTTTFNIYAELIADDTKNRQMTTEVTVTVENGGLLLQYPISGNVNEAIGDIAGQDGVVSGALFAEGVDGDPFGALSFDGVNDVVTLGDAPISTESFSLSLWVKVPTNGSTTANTVILSKRVACSEGQSIELSYRRSGDKIRFSSEIRSNAAAGSVSTGFDFPVDEWINVVFVKDNDTQQNRLIVNGVVEGETNWPFSPINLENSASIRLGFSPCNGVDGRLRYNGLIDDFRVYNRVVEPSVLSIEPAKGTTNASLDTVITVTFNKAVDASSLAATTVTISDADDVEYSYTTTFSKGDSVLTITPDNLFPKGKTINVAIDTLVAASSCTDFLPFQTSFSTIPTKLMSHSILNGETNVDSLQTISFKFDNAMDMSSLEDGIRVIGSHHGPVEGTFSMPETDSVVFTPSIPYFSNERITVYVRADLKDAGGESIANPRAFKFHVKSTTFVNATLSYVKKTLSTGSTATNSPRHLVPADMDGDGDLDLVGGDDNPGTLFYFENRGSGNYSEGRIIDSNNGYFDVKVTDFDFDGDQDIITVDRSVSEGIYVYTNDGSSNFTERRIVSLASSDSRSIVVADFEEGGDMDVAVASFGSNRLYSFDSDGNQLFAAANTGKVIFITDEDWNDDGNLDIVSGHFDPGLVALQTGGGNGVFSGLGLLSASQVRSVVPIVIDEDGDMDVVYSSQNGNRIGVLRNDGSAIFVDIQVGSVIGPHRLDVGDADGDGDLDILYTTAGTGADINFHYLENSGSLTLWTSNRLIVNDSYSGTFTQTATYADLDNDGDLDVVATDAAGGFYVFENMIIDLNEPPIVVNPAADQTLEEDDATGLAIDVSNVFTDNDGDTFTISASSDNAAVTAVMNGDNVELDIVTADFSGDVNITLTADDGNGTNTDVFLLSITPVNDAPLFDLSTAAIEVNEDFTTTETITVTQNQPADEDAPTYSISPTSVTFASVVIDAVTGEIAVSAVDNGFGSQEFTVTADDGATENNMATQTFVLTVNAVNDAPVVANALADVSLEEDPDINGRVVLTNTFNDVDGELLTLSIGVTSGADLAEVSLDAETINIAPGPNKFGVMQVEVMAEDAAGLSVSETFDVLINPVNDAPDFTVSDDVTVVKNFTSTETVTVTTGQVAFGEDSQTVTYTLSPASVTFANVSIEASTGNVTITAIVDEFGTQEFTITADDGEAMNNISTQTFTLTVLDNLPPEVISTVPNTSMNEDQATLAIVDVTSLFTDPEGDALTYEVSDEFAGNVAVALNGNTLEVTPIENFNGSGDITISARDAQQTISTAFTLTVIAINDVPTMIGTLTDQEAIEDESFSYTLPSGLFDDVDGDEITITAGTKPDWLSFDGSTFSGTPENGNVGTAGVEVVGDDGNGGLISATFNLSVSNVNDAPTVINGLEDIIVDEDAAATSIDITGIFEDVDTGDVLTIVSNTDNATLITVSDDGSNLMITYSADASGTATVSITATDLSGEMATDELLVTVNSINDAPMFTLSDTEINQEENFTGIISIDILAGAVPLDEVDQTVTYTISSEDTDVVNATINGTSIELSAITDTFGEQTFTVTADDGQDLNNTYMATFTVEVDRILAAGVGHGLRIYPNPVIKRLMFEGLEDIRVEVLSLDGRLFIEERVHGNGSLNVETLEEGTYLVRVDDGERVTVHRIIKTN